MTGFNQVLLAQMVGAIALMMAQPAMAGIASVTTDTGATETGPLPIAQSDPVVITNIQITQTAAGLALQVKTSGELVPAETYTIDNTAFADIANAVLRLPTGEAFEMSDPATGITLVQVTALANSQVRIAITGVEAPPLVDIAVSETGLSAIATPGTPTIPSAQSPESDPLRIVVTGEDTDDGYVVPNASTATRTNTSILDIPQSIQVVPQQVLEDQQILRVDDALRNVSGLVGRVDAFGSGSSLIIRGFSTDSFSNGPILRDGFRRTDNLGSQETANIERIEVIKGPSSVLYGQTDPGGLINLVTKRPLRDPFYELELQAGNQGLVRPSIDLTGPLNDEGTLGYRLNASYQTEDSYRGYDTDTETFFVAPVLSWDIRDRTNLTVLAEYTDEERGFEVGLPVIGDRVVDVLRDRVQNEPDDRLSSDTLILGYDVTHQFSDSWVLNHGFRYVTQDYNTFAALPLGVDETTGNITRFFADREYHSDDYSIQTNVVGNFNTGAIEHTLLAGIDLNFNRFDERFTRLDLTNPTPLNIFSPVYGTESRPDLSDVTPFPPFDTESDRYGFFLQDQIEFSKQFILVGSLRYDIVDFRNLTNRDNDRNDDAFSPRVGAVYKPIETVSIYANYSESFEPSEGSTVTGDSLSPQQSSGFEVGVKAELLDSNLFATLSYFDITKENVATTDPNNPFFSVATGEQRSQGVELDIAGEIIPGWNIIANYAYTDARITQDNTNPVGNRLLNSPQHSANLWTTYRIQTGDLEGLGFGLGVNYVGERFGDLANSFEVDDYWLTNAALFYEQEDWRFGLNFNNIFDINYIDSTSSRSFGNVPGEPFSVVGSVSVTF